MRKRTQSLVCVQVSGHDVEISIAAGPGQLELNVYKPLISQHVLDSIALLRDAKHAHHEGNTLREAALASGAR